MQHIVQHLYKKTILAKPKTTLLLLTLITLGLSAFIPQFRLDASSDSLLLENDDSLKYYREIKERYGSDDFLVLTYTPKEDLFSDAVLSDIATLKESLSDVDIVSSVTSILDVPLVDSPPITLDEFQKSAPTLTDPRTNKLMARKELLNSPLYSNLIISEDGKTTAILLNLKPYPQWQQLSKERATLKEKRRSSGLNESEEQQLEMVENQYVKLNARIQNEQANGIEHIRDKIKPHQSTAQIYLGGVPMIAADSIAFVRNDLQTFGIAVLIFIVILLTLFFRRIRWVVLPIINCVTVGIMMFGFLGLVGWPVTVVSSNFISLLLIFTLSFSVHQTVKYLEYQTKHHHASQQEIVTKSSTAIIIPCLFMVITTITAFGSLVVSGIRPVIDFGWMMTVGLTISFMVSFTLFPSVLMLLKPVEQIKHYDLTGKITEFFAQAIHQYGKIILITFIGMIIFVGIGIRFLTVENRFIDYYKESTEIYQGMKTIDEKLGGTTPLDVIIDAPADFMKEYNKKVQNYNLENPDDPYEPALIDGYWFIHPRKEMKEIHNYLDSQDELGKVISFDTTMEMARDLDPLAHNTIILGAMESKLPKDVSQMLFKSYVSEDGNQLRFNVRAYETDKSLKRDELLTRIKNHLIHDMGIDKDRVHLTGMMVMYNNVLQSLYDSQIKTIWTVFITIFVMFTILFKSPYIAGVAFLPNITITILVLGIMGWVGIPLDIMTITIAAICTGSADDNTIHYIHRFRQEFAKTGDYWESIKAAHGTIGRAMYYTSITIMLGFSILMFSNFVPTIYFGLLTAFAMLMAMLANLVLLPLLLTLFKPINAKK